MFIDAIEAYYVVLPLIYPWRTAYGEDYEIHTVLVRMLSGEHEGWGETSPLEAPTYSPEFALSAFLLNAEWFAPRLVGRDIPSADELLKALALYKGNPFAKGGVETAWWMLQAAIEAKPLHHLLGGETRPVAAGADFGIQDSYDMLLGNIQTAVDQGYRRVKLKVRPGWDLEMLRVVRTTFPRLTMHIDCNSGYSLNDLAFFKEVDRLGLAMIEQPLHHTDLIDHARLQSQLHTPICLDESIKSRRDFEQAMDLGACRVANIKIGRVGGLSVAFQIHDLARQHGIPCWVGGMLESAIGSGINIELATLPNFTYPADIFESRRFYRQDICDPEVWMNPDCTFDPSRVPGIPYRPNLERIEQQTRHKMRVEASGKSVRSYRF